MIVPIVLPIELKADHAIQTCKIRSGDTLLECESIELKTVLEAVSPKTILCDCCDEPMVDGNHVCVDDSSANSTICDETIDNGDDISKEFDWSQFALTAHNLKRRHTEVKYPKPP